MALVDRRSYSVVLRIVYDGPPEAGKTTNLQHLRERLSLRGRGTFESVGGGERAQYFDWLDVTGGWAGGHRVRVQLVSAPGQIQLAHRRRHLLDSADAVVFIADSRARAVPEGHAALRSLARGLGGHADVPLIVQANKQDLPGAHPPDRLHGALGLAARVPVVGAQAARGTGVLETFLLAVRLAVDHVRALLVAGELGDPDADSTAALLRALDADAEDVFEALDAIARAASSTAASEPAISSARTVEELSPWLREARRLAAGTTRPSGVLAAAAPVIKPAVCVARAAQGIAPRDPPDPARLRSAATQTVPTASPPPRAVAPAPVAAASGTVPGATAYGTDPGALAPPPGRTRSGAPAPGEYPSVARTVTHRSQAGREPRTTTPSTEAARGKRAGFDHLVAAAALSSPVAVALAIDHAPEPEIAAASEPAAPARPMRTTIELTADAVTPIALGFAGSDHDDTWELEAVAPGPRGPGTVDIRALEGSPTIDLVPAPLALAGGPGGAAEPAAHPVWSSLDAPRPREALPFRLPPADLPSSLIWPEAAGRAALAAIGAPVRIAMPATPWAPAGASELVCQDGWLAHTAAHLTFPGMARAQAALLEATRWQTGLAGLAPPGRAYVLSPDDDGVRLWVLTPAFRTVWTSIEEAFARADRAAAGRLARRGLDAVDELRVRGVPIHDLDHVAVDEPARLLATPWTPRRDRLVVQLQHLFSAAVL